ncbi:MAG: amidohydrolase [Lachnospiraceae bacterium]|nr:amidohydrolase [Lachnospiraceae bacterium]
MSQYIIIDAHVHLWEKQEGCVNGESIYGIGNGKSNFCGETRQMMPPYLEDNKNTAERLIANMDYAGVNACAVTQEYIDGNQNEYLLKVKEKYPDRFRITALFEDEGYRGKGFSPNGLGDIDLKDFDGIKICAGRLKNSDLTAITDVFKKAQTAGKYISIDLADGDEQTESLQKVIDECPDLKIAIGHFGMVTTKGWQKQIELAKNKNVFIESGGLTWLFHKEFYPYPSAIDAILEARDICGMEKLMWGSDYPRTMTDITYKSAIRFILETPKMTDEEKAAFLGKNAEKFYGFKNLVPLPEIDNML